MKQDWLDDLIALLDTGSVVSAAAARNISQSAFSRRIQGLEGALGIELIDRSSKPNLPTSALRTRGDEIRELASRQKQLIKQIQIEGRSGTKQLVIASQHAITTSLGHLIVKAVSSNGKMHVRLRSANLDECQVLLLTEQADLALTYQLPGEAPPSNNLLVEEMIISEDTLVPVYAAKDVNQFMWKFHTGEVDIIAYPSDVFLGMELSRHILPELESKCRINNVAETALSPAALQLAASSVGLAWVPRALASHRLNDGSLVDLGDQFGRVQMNVVAQRLRSKAENFNPSIWTQLAALR